MNQKGTDLTSFGSGNAIGKKARPTGPAILKKARIAFALSFLYFYPDVAFAGGAGVHGKLLSLKIAGLCG